MIVGCGPTTRSRANFVESQQKATMENSEKEQHAQPIVVPPKSLIKRPMPTEAKW